MNDRLTDSIHYIFANYANNKVPQSDLIKILYLADWAAACKLGRLITGVKWEWEGYGAFSTDILFQLREDRSFTFDKKDSRRERTLVVRDEKVTEKSITLKEQEKRILNFVLTQTRDLDSHEISQLSRDTYPIRCMINGEKDFNLVKLALQFKEK